ncbi:MAG: hypothetical protein NTY19_09430 [Planctomycetota bacterium]|nr:hypothetical protein [Planctomycetota bacterium]
MDAPLTVASVDLLRYALATLFRQLLDLLFGRLHLIGRGARQVTGLLVAFHRGVPVAGPHLAVASGQYPYSAEQCVALSEEDLATLEPTDDKTIHLEHFLSPTEFDLTLLAGRSLYLAPPIRRQ